MAKFFSQDYLRMYVPKLVTVLREGYGLPQLRADAIAALTVAIVAMPLSMAIAIGSGVSPERGLFTAIIGGFLISLLGGSRFQIGGPAGAFIILVAATVQNFGVDGVILATMMAGCMLVLAGFLGLGTYIKFIPYPVTVGFTAGIAVIIFTSQIKELLGLHLPGGEPAEIVEKIPVLWHALPTFTPEALGIAALTVIIIQGLKKWAPHLPGMLIAIAVAGVLTTAAGFEIDTISTRFGGIPSMLPAPALPDISLERVYDLLPSAFAFALLGAIESLLSAVVADGMTGRHHRSNCELAAQGIANIGSGLFGGICVTGAIARTATNIRAGAHGPVSGMLHAVSLLLFMLIAAPVMGYIPLAALAGVLVVVAWNMAERHAFGTLVRASGGDALVLLSTFFLTVFRDLTEAIIVGFALGSVLFINRMSKTAAVQVHAPMVQKDVADAPTDARTPYDADVAAASNVVVYRITGAFFFGAASTVSSVLDNIAAEHKTFIVDFSETALVDATAANAIAGMARKAKGRGVQVILTGTSADIRHVLMAHGLRRPLVSYMASIESATRGKPRMQAEDAIIT